MFATQFGRIFWKEYRSQRTLWLSCLLMEIVYLVLVLIFTSNAVQTIQLLWGTATVFPILYAVACGAVLFAGERESRGSDWLLSLSNSPAATLSAKIAFAIVATMAMQLISALPTLIFSGIYFQFGYSPSPAWLLIPYGLWVLCWSILGSLLSRRVFTSLGAMVFGVILTLYIPLILTMSLMYLFLRRELDSGHPISNAIFFVFMVCLTLVVIWIDVQLGLRWCQGKYVDGTIIERFLASFEQWLRNRTGHVAKAARIPNRVEFDQPWRRTWQRLIWQERHRESLPILIAVVGCALGSMITIVDVIGLSGSVVFVFALCLAIPTLMGVLTFESDTEGSRFRFLANRGLPEASIWFAKQAVWLPRAFWITAAIFFSSLIVEGLAGSVRDLFMHSKRMPQDPSMDAAFKVLSQNWDLTIYFVLLSYACGQLASMIFSRAVLAGVFGFVLTGFTVFWGRQALLAEIPIFWTLGFPFLSMLLFTFWQMKPQMLEERTLFRSGKMALVLVSLVVVCYLGGVVYEVAFANSYEKISVPLSTRTFNVTN